MPERKRFFSIDPFPYLLAIGIGLPESDAVLLGHVPALGQQLRVRDCLLALGRKVNNQNIFVQFVEKRPKMR